jgi:hypothetical protein
MTEPDGPATGWSFVADNDGAARLLGTVLELDPNETYTKSDIASAADVPMKRLYLSDALEGLVEVDVLVPVEDGGEEATYEVDPESAVYREAAAFDDAVASRIDG